MTQTITFRFSFLFCMIFILLSSNAIAQKSSLKKLEKQVTRLAEQTKIPSLDLIVRTDNDILNIDYFHKDVSSQEMYGLGSASKLLSAVLFFHIASEKDIALDAQVSEYINSDIGKHVEGYEEITFGELLNHTSGISDYTKHPEWIQLVLKNDAPGTFEEKFALVSDTLTNRGSFSYSNSNYLLLEQVIESITGKPYNQVFQEFYHTYNLEAVTMNPEGTSEAYFAQKENEISNVSQWNEYYGFDGGAYITAEAADKFLQMLFVEKSILTEQSLDQMQHWVPMEPMTIPVGDGNVVEYGYGIMKLEYNGKKYIGHSGGTLKYQSFLFYDPANKVSLVALTNCSGRYYNNVFFQQLIPMVLDTF